MVALVDLGQRRAKMRLHMCEHEGNFSDERHSNSVPKDKISDLSKFKEFAKDECM